ncbi:LysR family transcriptional regulator [Pyruvatibacter mobilis]|uniref:LysR family transcriptional regulator n=1 Tax=Pyruvatibacter mobilis TaxID=1712261 RepID=A0A845Q9N6_9HYPH|nr:LysR substrate-binding domain-containing protein [Pyruvatibacter mobilis]NBG95262.1 LysR family transcriptional regulator [Pyruvatibacter mobilis]QJD75638.1 LysR family transcriptional regulator [Pyruvatibacter mobilis]GGD17294.1 transcriptional regulator [Pyruvatibacter mobilis]
MNFRDLDLNLLLVFNAIYAERSISRAAKKLGMSQPAVSSALKRLRHFTGDTLFYRSGQGVAPTRAAITLAVPIGHALDSVEQGLSSVRNFDPATSDRVFRIAAADIIRPTVIPALTRVVREEAPNVRLEFVVHQGGAVIEALRARQLDIGCVPPFLVEEDIRSAPVWRERMALVVSRTHPLANAGSVTIDQLKEMEFVFTTHLPAVNQYINSYFEQHGVERRRACTVPDTESIYKLVALTDIAAVTGRSFVNHHNIDGQLVVLDIPFELPEIDLHLAWTLAADSDRGHQWLRERMLSVLRSASRVMNFEVIAGDEEDGTA